MATADYKIEITLTPEEIEALKGEPGQDGADSTVPGPAGDSAYEVAVKNGFVGTETEWLASLKGEDGEDGQDGKDSTVPGPPGPGGSGGGLVGVVQLDSFAGANDDAKLTAALSYVQAQSRMPYIQFPARDITLNKTYTAFTGMKLIGPNSPGPKNLEIQGGKPVNHRVMLGSNIGTGSKSLFVGSGSIYDVYVSNLAFQGNFNQQFWDQPTGTLYACEFNSLTFYGFKHVFGRTDAKALLTQVIFTGHWTDLAFSDTQYNIGGSDNDFWVNGYLNIGSSNPGGAGKYMLRFDGIGKTNVGPVYVTAESGWLGVDVANANKGITFFGPRLEGRNAGTPCDGAVIRVRAGFVRLVSPWIAYAMANPTAHGGSSQGVIHVDGGNVVVDSPMYERAGSVGESVPFVYAAGGRVAVNNVGAVGSWSQPPVVRAVGAALSVDNSVRVI